MIVVEFEGVRHYGKPGWSERPVRVREDFGEWRPVKDRDGKKIAANVRDLDRYMKYAGFDAMYVEYEGRGNEHFADEILRLFEWMALYKRDFARQDFTVTSMRPWDQFFWWVELGEIPERFVVLPANWPQS